MWEERKKLNYDDDHDHDDYPNHQMENWHKQKKMNGKILSI